MKRIFLFFTGLAFASSLQAQQLPLDPAVRTGKLANGFSYFIRHNDEPQKRVTIYLVNKVGSILEDEDQRGLAHFMEHMSFNGTKNFPHNELINYLQKSGIRFGADINAYTSFDETVYQLPLPTDKPELLEKGLLIMHDWAQFATLDATEIEKERGVVLEEKRLGKGVRDRLQQQYYPLITNHSRYAERLPIGIDSVLLHFKPESIRRFYKDWYRPNLQALIVVGDISVDSMEQVIRKQFADLRNPKNEKARTRYTVPLTGKNQFISLTDKEITATQAQILIKYPEAPLQTASDYRAQILRSLFNQMLSERYAEIMRQADPAFVSGSASISPFMVGLDAFNANVVAKPNALEAGLKAVWREVIRAARFGFTQSELDRAKINYQTNIDALQKEKTNSSTYVQEYLDYFLKGTAAPGKAAEQALSKQQLPGISLAEVNALCAEYIQAKNRDILVMAPEKEKASLPDEKTVEQWLAEVAAENLTAYEDNMSDLPLLKEAPKAGHITAESHDKALGLISYTLSNGVKVVLKPTDFRNDEIVFSAYSAGGLSLVDDADFESGSVASSLIGNSGAGNYDDNQLGKFLTGKRLYVNTSIGNRSQSLNGYSSPADLEAALQLTYARLVEPRKDAAIFSGYQQRAHTSLLHRGDNPNAVFSDTIAAVTYNNNPRKTGPSLAKLQQVELDKAYRIYQQRFADASGMTFIFTGNIDTAAIKPLLEKYIASLPASHQAEEARDLGIQPRAGQFEKTVYKGSEDKATVLLVYSGDFDFTPENRLRLDALKEALQIRLVERLREEESGVYAPAAQASVQKYPAGHFNLAIQFGCAPANVDKLIASAKDEVNKLQTQGPKQENIDKWRAELRTASETDLRSNWFWLAYLNDQLQNKEPFDAILQQDKQRDAVSAADVQALAKQYLNGKNIAQFVLLPESK